MQPRTRRAVALATLTLVVVLGSWFQVGWSGVQTSGNALKEAPGKEAESELRRVGMRLASRLDSLRKAEDKRPYYHYQNLFHDPRGLSAGNSIGPSPLVMETGDSLISVHFQVGGDRVLSIPPINEELEEFSDKNKLQLNQRKLVMLRQSQDELVGPRTRVVAAQVPEPRQALVQQQVFSNAEFIQNANPNLAFQELQGQQAQQVQSTAQTSAADPEASTSIEVAIHGFLWKKVELDGQMELVAVRNIESEKGRLEQGFVVGASQVQKWLRSEVRKSYQFQLVSSLVATPSARSVEVPTMPGWYLVTDLSEQELAASTSAASLRSDFLWRFVPSALLTIALLLVLVHSVSRSEKLAQERSQFAAAAAHELRTPLASLQLYGDMLADGLGDPSAKEKYARQIADEAQRLGRVVSNVLDFSQMEQNGIAVRAARGNLSRSVRELVERMRHSLEKSGMEIELELGPDIVAVYDEDAVSRVLQNLLDNAEKYSREQSDRRLRITVSEGESIASVEVQDNGPGISGPDKHRVFDAFTRNSDADSPAGLGLGLALARALAEKQGGHLRCQTGSLGGASFVLEIPSPV